MDLRYLGCVALLIVPTAGAEAASLPGLSALQSVSPTVLQQIGLDQPGCETWQTSLSDSGTILAVEVNCEEADGGRRVWLVEDGQRAVAATPDLGPGNPNDDAVFGTGVDLYWDADTLYISTFIELPLADEEEYPGSEQVDYSATLAGSTRLESIPDDVLQAAEQRKRQWHPEDWTEVLDNADAIGESVLTLGSPAEGYLVWLDEQPDQGDVFTLFMRDMTEGATAREIVRGGDELLNFRFDSWHVFYPTPTDIRVYDLKTGQSQIIAGSTPDSGLLEWHEQTSSLVWKSHQPCTGGETTAYLNLCIAHVDGLDLP